MKEKENLSIAQVVKKYNLNPNKSLGQNFIFDKSLLNKIASLSDPKGVEVILEIGPGPGGLTRALIENGANKIYLIEQDIRFKGPIDEIINDYPNKIIVRYEDALKFNYLNQFSKNVVITSNLPFNIATPLLINWLSVDPWPGWWSRMILMFQKEVAERITAEPCNKNYGRLSVISQCRAKCKILLKVNSTAFYPAPKVDSSIVLFEPLKDLEVEIKTIEKITRHAFGQRRKMLKSSLKSIIPDTTYFLKAINIDAEKRAEEISVEEYVVISKAYEYHFH
ncbi:16S rRNA (adenine(1518)-N(6)/adenine(1519)-N(6))-dimethyltransferase RsmA [Hyphomicrobiales bacterium]|nr:16S rRNA (adenine(1518)-N(6)/adenine(1519)-N(6))-dimethyltransferase RsmA [Rhodobiaceae bacterium]MBT5640243.1 16S rRNA (adenine(1518)-N(6)/adenine(1519)-N(6))-dimethyltransferase RsmA [Rhodobiaceae bacterium]MBT6222432.1 16S rRNA (adenine(1518)-N(6)/adenine(1519)-N(6))-dimethyltransferase RsmA [Rhodobiaceae bacterium]MDC0139991.1 16S rRNA (adenine(1518)-N(6)/adenine(1519)-N(6))-dimethyltransferase RsmA [Hyphomicrobiales bacterium]MDC3272588.1 16S rRNA (adenine(1518)-N(6)/adenine(1519)-N(6))